MLNLPKPTNQPRDKAKMKPATMSVVQKSNSGTGADDGTVFRQRPAMGMAQMRSSMQEDEDCVLGLGRSKANHSRSEVNRSKSEVNRSRSGRSKANQSRSEAN